MKKPIDPNLDNIIDDIISPDNYENADNAEPSLNKADLKDDNEINFSFTGSADVPEKKDLNRQNSGFEIEAKSGGEYHHSHHRSSGEHRHSSSSHHSHHHKKKKK